MRARARGMTLCLLGIGLFKTQGLDEYGTAAVGWLRGAGLKATEGPAEHWGGGIQTLTHTHSAQIQHTHRQPITQQRRKVNMQRFYLNLVKKSGYPVLTLKYE